MYSQSKEQGEEGRRGVKENCFGGSVEGERVVLGRVLLLAN
jgi:hypothetical protein